MENDTQTGRHWWKRPMSIVGGLTAVLGLVFAVQQLVGFVGDWHGRRQRLAEYIDVAAVERASRRYPEAWASLDSAARLDDNEAVRTAQEDLAMEWLRAARVREGEQTFTELVKPLMPVLERGALRAQGARKADLIAHEGWADFLRWRDGARELEPDAHYRRALEADPRNPYAHAMWGHWILFTGGDAQAARTHFDAALGSGRAHEYVRSMQLAAALNDRRDDSDDELLRVANQARVQADSAGPAYRDVFWRVCISSVANPDTWTRSATRITAADEIATLRWLAGNDSADAYHRDMLRFCEARAIASGGDTPHAREMLRTLETSAAGDATRARAKAAADRLAKR